MPTADHAKGAEAQTTAAWTLRGRILAGCVLAISSAVLTIGWGMDQPVVANFGNQFSAMVPSTAFLLAIGATAVLNEDAHSAPPIRSAFRRTVAVLILAVATTSLMLSISGRANGIDAWIWPDFPAFESASMSSATCLSFAMLGYCLWQNPDDAAGKKALIAGASVGTVLATLALITFAFDARSLSTTALFSTMSLPTALAFLMLFSALLIRHRHSAWMSAFIGTAPGTVSLRRMLPWTVGLPFLLILATNYALLQDLFDQTFQLSLLAVGTVLITVTILVREAFRANLLEEQAQSARDLFSRSAARQAELERRRHNAELAVQAKTKFLANMSHEIRTPMNGILGFSELVLQSELHPNQRSKIEMIHESGETMLRLIDDILDLAKIDTGHLSVNEDQFDIRHIANSCIKMFHVAAAKKGLALRLHAPTDLKCEAIGDPLRMRQVLTNVIGNAIKFTEQGHIDVHLAARDDQVVLTVTDTGIGIAKDKQQQVLGEFVQADESTQRRYGGSGLGLHISKKLVELMKGTLELASEPDKGTTVTIALRAAWPNPGKIDSSAVTDSREPESSGRWSGRRIGIAEDHDINQMMIIDMVHHLGAEPIIFPNGAEAISGIEAAQDSGQQFDLFLMDIQMPELDGISATKEIRRRGHDAGELPIIAMTANAFDTDVSASLDAGMQAHLAKPVSLEKLDEAFAEWIPAPAE